MAIFLLLGAMVNIAVAWGGAIFVDFSSRPDANQAKSSYGPLPTGIDGQGEWGVCVTECSQAVLYDVWRDGVVDVFTSKGRQQCDPISLLPAWWTTLHAEEFVDIPDEHSIWNVAIGSGWPASSMWQEYEGHRRSYTGAYEQEMTLRGGVELPGIAPFTRASWWPTYPRGLPLRPIWPGFAINTVFYALILWLLICGPNVLRRRMRRSRGLCTMCGYDLRGDIDAGCPECGWGRPRKMILEDEGVKG
jgi:hypothetical protein